MKVYISGKIGEEVISEATRQKFARAEEMLKAKGYEVFNPCDERWQEFLSLNWSAAAPVAVMDRYTYILLKDLQKLAKCDAIYMLADWTESDGANVELDFARATRKQLFWESEEDALVFNNDENPYSVWLPL